MRFNFGFNTGADEVAQETAEQAYVRGAGQNLTPNEMQAPEGGSDWGSRGGGFIRGNEVAHESSGSRYEYTSTQPQERESRTPTYDQSSKYTFGMGIPRTGDTTDNRTESGMSAAVATMMGREPVAMPEQPVAEQPRIPRPDLSKIGGGEYYSGDQGDDVWGLEPEASADNEGGWTAFDELSSIPISSYSSRAVDDAGIERARKSDEKTEDVWTGKLSTGKSQLGELRKEARENARAAKRNGEHGYNVPDLNDGTIDESGKYTDPYRSKTEIDYSDLPSNKRLSKQAVDSEKNQYKIRLSRDDVGGRVWEKLLPDSRLRFNEVGMGIGDLEALLEQDPTHLNELLKDIFPDGASNHSISTIAWNINYASRRETGNAVRVGVSKPPDVRISDAQSMILRIVSDQPRGIFIHPLVAPLFNADFDGDDAHMSLSQKMAKVLRDTIDLLIDFDGTTHIDEKWFTTTRIVDNVIDGISRRDFVREVMFGDLMYFDNIEVNDAIIDAVLALGDNTNPKMKNELLVNLIRELRSFTGSNNDMLGKMLLMTYNTFQDLSRKMAAETVGVYVDVPVQPRNENDRILLNFVDDVVKGKIPANWYDFKRAFNSFIGDIRSGNSDFRVSASVGKRFKLDNRLVIGGEYVIDLGNEKQVDTFLEATMEYASAMRQSHEEKLRGRSYSHTKQLKETIISKVGYPDDVMTDGEGNESPRYRSIVDWLNTFIKVYRIESALENEANLIVKANLQISQMSNRNVVDTINPSGSNNRVTYSDIVPALVSVYGDSSLDRLFHNILWKEQQVLSDKRIESGWKEREVWRPGNRGNFAMKEKYRSYSLRRYSKDNHVVYNHTLQDGMNKCIIPVINPRTGLWVVESYGKNKGGQYETETREIQNVSDNMVETYLLMAIADQKTSSESAYASRVYGYVEHKSKRIRPTFGHNAQYQSAQERTNEETNKYYDESGQHKTLMKMRFDLLQDMKQAMKRDNHESRVEVREILRALNSSGPELFSYFGLDNEIGWKDSVFSKAMLKARNLDQLGGVNMTMHYVMRTNEIVASLKALDAYKDSPGMVEMQAQTMNEISFMQQELASASQTWQAIVMEMQTGSGWSSLHDLAIDMKENPSKYEGANVYLEAKEYWENPLHQSVDEMMSDALMGFAEKRDILCDLVRMQTGDPYFTSYEVCLQLEVGSTGEWSLQSDGQKQLFETYNDFERKFNQYADTGYKNMVENIEDAYERFGDQKGALIGAIHNLATHPGTLCKVGFDTMADAVCSTMDRLYDQSEKSSTHPWSNGGYQLLSMQRNGGYVNELFRTDDLIVGSQNLKQVTVSDFIRLLDDPKFVLTGYNDIGQLKQVNRDQLLGFERGESYDVEREIWRFLRENPRLGGCLRMQSGAISAGMEAKGYMVAACDTTETIARAYGHDAESVHNPLDDVAYLMFDHPGFHAIASLCTPAAGSKASHRSPKIAATERYLCYLIYSNATKDPRSLEVNTDKILNTLGITRSSINENLMNDFDRMISGIDGLEERQEAINERNAVVNGLVDEDGNVVMYGMYDNCRTFIRNYLKEVAESPSVDLKLGIRGIERPELQVDRSSVHSFYDVIQELSGAKTEVSTGIEGSETFQFGVWSSLIAAEDRYASLLAIQEELEDDPELCQTFDGAMTNGGIIRVVNGIIENIDELKQNAGNDELVVLCPETYKVKDRMIDSHGRTMPSQKSLMMSKRADGTEGHNLQVMKTGIDGLDSITKVKSKYFFDSDGTMIDYDMRLQIIRDEAAKGKTEDEQMFLAKLCLAKELLKSNTELGYNAWTLANYMSITDLMLIRGDDGQIYLRSLEQLYTAIKHRIGVYGNEMSNDQRKQAAMSIVNDTSEYAIGRATASPIGAFDALKPARVSPSTRGIYPYLSNRDANRNTIDEIVKELESRIGQERTEEEIAWSALKRKTVENRIRDNHKWINKVLKNAFVLRQYHVVGCADGSRIDENHEVGMSSLFIIGESIGNRMDTTSLRKLMNRCYHHGETIMIEATLIDDGYVHPSYVREAMPCVLADDGTPQWYMINTFHIRLNGVEAKAYKGAYAQAQYPYEKDWFVAEDTFGEFDYGDSGGLVTQHGHDKVSLSSQPQTIEISVEKLFEQQFKKLGIERLNDHGTIDVSFVDQRTLDGVLNHTIDIEIDVGVVEGADGYERRVRDIESAIERYKQKQDDGDGMIYGQDCHAGDIVGWAMAKVRENDGGVRYVLAPIIPFELYDKKRGMETFQCTDITFKDGDRNRIAVTMRNTSELDGYAKMHLPSSGADKIMVNLSSIVDRDDNPRTLMDGTMLDSYVDARTTMSRRIGTLSRLRTMETLIRMARMNGYNFADAAGAFPEADPNAPEGSREWSAYAIKEALKNYPPPSQDDWRKVFNDIKFHSDPLIDAFVRHNCKKCLDDGGNPSHFLASQFVDESIDPNNPINSMFQWEYLASFENSLTYEDAFLKFFHLLNPHGNFNGEFCPNGIDDASSNCLFRLKQDQNGVLADGYDLGVLQMQVPHRFKDISDGSNRWVYIWECVFSGTGFFGEDFSAGSRPNIEGASRMSDTMNMIGSLDFDLSEADNRLRYGYSIADMGALPMTGSAITM